jgi:hypothetical protein
MTEASRKPSEKREEEKPMSENGQAIVVTLLLCVAVLAMYWKQVAVLMTLAASMVFCAGIYFIVSTLHL